GVRVLRLRGGDGAAGANHAGLPPVPLPVLRQAVQRAQRRPAEPGAVPFRRRRARGAVALAPPADPARPQRDVPRPRDRVQPRGGAGLGGQAHARPGRRTPAAPARQGRHPRPPLARGRDV
ncbi:MAG: hypothetical protein AVDCRST_MAG64-3236, partial [uncultured Phycisphaerae bacterium]